MWQDHATWLQDAPSHGGVLTDESREIARVGDDGVAALAVHDVASDVWRVEKVKDKVVVSKQFHALHLGDGLRHLVWRRGREGHGHYGGHG